MIPYIKGKANKVADGLSLRTNQSNIDMQYTKELLRKFKSKVLQDSILVQLLAWKSTKSPLCEDIKVTMTLCVFIKVIKEDSV